MKYNGSLTPEVNRREVQRIRKLIKYNKVVFDYIAYRGNSGALLAAPLSLKLNKRLVNVRKEKNSHGMPVEGITSGRFIIVDDFIVSGSTIDYIFNYCPVKDCVGIFVTGTHREFDSNEFRKVPVFYTSREDVNDNDY